MKKTIITSILSLCISIAVHGQRITKNEARQVLEKAISCLRTSDTASFIGLWHFDSSAWPYHEGKFTERSATSCFYHMKEFLDTALTQTLAVDAIEIDKVDAEERALNSGRYTIRVWFKYDTNYYKGFGFYMDYIDKKWVVRFTPDTSIMTTG